MDISNKISIYIKTDILALILEGKKEEVAEKLKQKFEYDNRFIDSVLDLDPTGYKYIDYIAKQLEKHITDFGGPRGGLNTQQTSALYNVFEDIIPWFHNSSGRISPEFLKQARDRYIIAMDRDVENFDKILKSPKDITNYHPYFIQTLKNVVEENKSNKEKEKDAKSQVEKLYEDDKYLILKPKTYEASCYYGSGTKWCTSSKDTKEHFRKYTREGELYYFIDKTNSNKIALHKDGSDKEIFDMFDNKITSAVLLDNFPLDITEELLGGGLLRVLVNYAKGNALRSDVLSAEEMIRNIIPDKPLGKSELIIDFEKDVDFFSLIGVDENDANFASWVTSSHDSWDFTDSYQVMEDFKEGYNVYGDIDKENMEKLNLISTLIMGGKKFDLDDDKFKQELSKKLIDLFPREMDYIISDWDTEYNYMMNQSANKKVTEDVEEYLNRFGFSIKSEFQSISTTIGNLVMWYVRLNKEKLDLYSLMKNIFETNKNTIGGWYEDQYSFEDENFFDKTSFNNVVTRQFDNIIEKIEDNSDRAGLSIKDFIDMVERIQNKFSKKNWTELPKNKKITYRIEGFDLDTMKIIVLVNHPEKGIKKIMLSEENFYNLLYQPELFEFGEI